MLLHFRLAIHFRASQSVLRFYGNRFEMGDAEPFVSAIRYRVQVHFLCNLLTLAAGGSLLDCLRGPVSHSYSEKTLSLGYVSDVSTRISKFER